jgi:hypothetical protein
LVESDPFTGRADRVPAITVNAKYSAGFGHLRDAQAVCHEAVSEPALDVLEAGGALICRLLPTNERAPVVAAVSER